MPPRSRLVLNDPEATGVTGGEEYVDEALAALPNKARRMAQRKVLKMRTTTKQRAITMADVPPGSVLSDATIAAIQAGQYALAADIQRPTSPVYTKKPLVKKKHQMAKQSRKRNRGK